MKHWPRFKVAAKKKNGSAKESYKAFAYRELTNYAEGGDAAVQAKLDLEAKLDSFNGRFTRK